MDKLKIGIIGCGKQAPKHIQGLRRMPGVELVLADSNSGSTRALAQEYGLPWVRDPGEVFEDKSVRAVLICTPTPSHLPLIRRAVESGKDFFCEKPLCEDLQAARELDELVRKSGTVGMVGYVYRYVPVFDLAYRLFEDVPQLGESMVLGRPVASFFRLGGRGSHQEWKHKKATGGGAVNEMLVHMIDLSIWYFGAVVEAEYLAYDILRADRVINGEQVVADAEDYVVVRMKTAGGVEVLCQADLVTPVFTQLVEIQGENGTFMGSIQSEMPSFVFCNEPRAGYPAGKTGLTFGVTNVFEAQMAEFVRILRRRIQPRRCTIRDSVLLLEAVDKLNTSRAREFTAKKKE